MASTDTANSDKSLHNNEDRNLLRIREKERRNQEALQERECFLENAPLFAEPYKTKKGDELSSRIQSMLGNYEEVKEFISTKAHQDLFGIPKNATPLALQAKSDRLPLSAKAGTMSQPEFQKPMGPPTSAPSSGNGSGQHRKAHPGKEQTSSLHKKSYSMSQSRSQGQSHCDQMGRSSRNHKKNDRHADSSSCTEDELSSPSSSFSKLSPLLSSLSSPVAPLSPIHSNQHIGSRIQNSKSRASVYHHTTKTPPVLESSDSETRDSSTSATNLALSTQPSSQSFPPPLPSKTSALQQKPTAYVRPMDGQDQAPSKSPELKPLPEDYHGQSYGNIAVLKASAKAKLAKLNIPSEPIEQTFSNEVHCVEEILKEMTHSWPPPLTAIHTPSTAEPSKFPFSTKESHHISSVKKTHKQHDTTSKALPSPQQGTSTLEVDLEISDSEDSEVDQNTRVSEEPPPSSAPPSALQSQPDSVASAHSSSAESESTSDSDSSSDSESESSSSGSEAKKPPRAATPEPDPPSNIWQLNNWLNKGSQPAALADHPSEEGPDQHSQQERKGEVQCTSSSSEPSESKEPALQKAPRTSQEGHHQGKRSSQKSPAVHSEGPPPRQTVGTKQPRKPGKALVQEPPKGGLTVESEPGPYGTKEQPSKEKPKVKTKVKTSDRKDPKPTESLPSEKKKHKSSHQAPSKALSESGPEKVHVARVRVELSGSPQSHKQSTAHNRTSDSKPTVVIREETHRDKVPLPTRDSRLVSHRENQASDTLIVKIELSLLSRVPQKNCHQKKKKVESKEPSSRLKQDSEKKSTEAPIKVPKKRKVEEEVKISENKKIKLEKEPKLTTSSSQKESSKIKISKPPSECPKKEPLNPAPMSPTQNVQKPASTTHKRRSSGSNPCSQDPVEKSSTATVKSKSGHKDSSSSSKHMKVEEKHSGLPKSNKGSVERNTNPFPVPSLPNGNSKSMRPQLKFDEKTYPAEHYLKEAKKLKHKADVMSDKVGKAFNYLDAALYFIECGTAMEPDTPATKSAYTMFLETVDLIKFIMKLKNFTETSTTIIEKTFAVMCMRCQSLLYLMMFRHKKDTAIKYSRTLSEHFKSSSRAAQAPSPCIARSTGTPSPLSPTPSPASSGSSQSGSNASNTGSGGIGSSVSIPHMIHQIAASYVNITSYFLHAYDIWEQADILAKKNKEFFVELSTVVCPLALNSSMTELVHYTRQGLQWLRLESNMP